MFLPQAGRKLKGPIIQTIQVNMDLYKRCIWFITGILNVNLQNFVTLFTCLPPTGTKLLYPKSTFMWKINRNAKAFRKQSRLQTIYSLIFIRLLCHSSHMKKYVCGILMGLFWTKEWRNEQNPFRNLTAALVEHQAQSRKSAE